MDDEQRTPNLINEYLKMRQKLGELEHIRNESVKTEQALDRFQQFFSRIDDLAYICDANGQIIYLNVAFERFTGRKPDDLYGKPFTGLFDGEDCRKALELFESSLQGGTSVSALRFRDTGILCECKNAPLKDEYGKITGFMGMARDMTGRSAALDRITRYAARLEEMLYERTEELNGAKKRLEDELAGHERAKKALKEANERILKLLEAANDAIVLFDASDNLIFYANPKAAELFGSPVSEIIGMHSFSLHPVKESDYYKNVYRELLEEKNPSPGEIFFVCHKTGRYIPVRMSVKKPEMNGRQIIKTAFRDLTGSAHKPNAR